MTDVAPLTTEADLAGLLQMDERHVADLRRQEKWPHVRIGRAYRYTDEQIKQIIARYAVAPKPETRAAKALGGLTSRSAARRRSA